MRSRAVSAGVPTFRSRSTLSNPATEYPVTGTPSNPAIKYRRKNMRMNDIIAMNQMKHLQEARELGWTENICTDIAMAVDAEAKRTKIAAQFVPHFEIDMSMAGSSTGMNNMARRTIQSDALADQTVSELSIAEVDEVSILEIWTEFSLTDPQFLDEAALKTANTLAVVAANKLSRAQDLLIFQGRVGLEDPLFKNGTVSLRGVSFDQQGTAIIPNSLRFTGFLEVVPSTQRILVFPTEADPDPSINRYGENTFGEVARAYSILQRSHYGRNAVALPTNAFADTFRPLRTTLIMPADRIKGLVDDRFYSTSALPNDFDSQTHPPIVPRGVVVAMDGNTFDLVETVPATVEYLQKSGETKNGGTHLLRVYQRFAFRLKDRQSVASLDFQAKAKPQ